MSEGDSKDDSTMKQTNGGEKLEERGGGDADVLSEEKEHKGLFEQPVVIEGKRERKKVERLTASQIVDEPKKKKEVVFVEGKGTGLGEIPYVSAMITKMKAEDLNILHRCLFDTNTTHYKVKQNIRKFNGFDFEKGSKGYEKRDDLLNRAYWSVLTNQFLKVLGLEKAKGSKEETVNKILEFLIKPYDHGKKVPGKKKSKSKKSKKRTSSTSKKEPKAKKAKKETTEGDEADESSSDESDQEDSGAESGGDVDAEEDSTTPKKSAPKNQEKSAEKKKTPKKKEEASEKKKKTPAKKTTPKERKKKETTTPKKKSTPKKEKPSVELSTDTTDSDDEPLIKKSKVPPNDVELKQTITKILEGANLEQVTMKTVCQAVYSKYPDFDLTHRKDFIKSTVRELIN